MVDRADRVQYRTCAETCTGVYMLSGFDSARLEPRVEFAWRTRMHSTEAPLHGRGEWGKANRCSLPESCRRMTRCETTNGKTFVTKSSANCGVQIEQRWRIDRSATLRSRRVGNQASDVHIALPTIFHPSRAFQQDMHRPQCFACDRCRDLATRRSRDARTPLGVI
jgi:hypothetical protein